MKFTVRHRLPMNEADFWKRVFFSEEFNRKLYLEGLKFTKFEVIEQREEPDGGLFRKLRLETQNEAPAVITKLVGNSLTYIETGRLDPQTKRWAYEVQPGKAADRIRVTGVVWTQPVGPTEVERIDEVEVTVKIFGVGSVIEGFLEKQTRRSLEIAAQFATKFGKEPTEK